MSWQALNWAIATETPDSSCKVVLILLANRVKEDGTCFPSQRRLARESQLSERTVRTALGRLEEAGLLSRSRRHRADGTRSSDLITLDLPATASGSEEGLPATASGPTGNHCRAEPKGEPTTASSPSPYSGRRHFSPGIGWINEV